MDKKIGLISGGALTAVLLILAWQGYRRIKTPKRKRKAALW